MFLTNNKILTSIICLLILPLTIYGQGEIDTIDYENRTFMPLIQIGYISHGTEELSGGLMTQVSLEYRDISHFIFRINYDNFNANMDVKYPINTYVSFTGTTSISEFIGGIGYRQHLNKHNITGYLQSGIRFYGYPEFIEDNNQVNLNFDRRKIGVMRYSLGYEYELSSKLFLTIETIISHVLKPKDFWTNNSWSYGVNFGLSAPL